jgi:hypothetical protein
MCGACAVTKVIRNNLDLRHIHVNIIWVIKSRRMRWTGHVTRIGRREEVLTGFWWGNLRERDHLEDLGVVGRMILQWIFRKWDGGRGHGLD